MANVTQLAARASLRRIEETEEQMELDRRERNGNRNAERKLQKEREEAPSEEKKKKAKKKRPYKRRKKSAVKKSKEKEMASPDKLGVRGGRPAMYSRFQLTKELTTDLIDQLADLMRHGNYYENACDICCLRTNTFRSWMAKGERDLDRGQEDTLEANLYLACKKAAGEAADEALKEIRKRKFNWQALGWFLERRLPSQFGARQRFEHTGAQGGPINHTHDLSKLTMDELQQLRTIVDKASSDEGGAGN